MKNYRATISIKGQKPVHIELTAPSAIAALATPEVNDVIAEHGYSKPHVVSIAPIR